MLFYPDARVDFRKDGILFTEQDILFSKYDFKGDLKIKIKLDYLKSGFGIVLADKSGNTPREAEKLHLIKLGSNTFEVISKDLRSQNISKKNSCIFPAGKSDIEIQFAINKKKVSFICLTDNNELGKYTLMKPFSEYYVGFYSNAGNIIKSIDFQTGAPINWHTSIKNTLGGRIEYFKNGFKLENCEKDAEIEQQTIYLKRGKYFLNYKKEPVNGLYDINAYVFSAEPKAKKDEYFEDEKKNILDKKNRINAKKEGYYILKFEGRNGQVSEIDIAYDKDSFYIETEEEPRSEEGSYIKVKLDEIAKIEIDAEIYSFPEADDYEEAESIYKYAIAKTSQTSVHKEDLAVEKNELYTYTFKTSDNLFRAYNPISKTNAAYLIKFDEGDKNTITLFFNVNARISRFIITKTDGTVINVMIQQEQQAYVPGEVKGPIIVTDLNEKTLDISAAYREVAIPKKTFEIFKTDDESMTLKSFPVTGNTEVYGIPKEAIIDPQGETIEEYATTYRKIDLSKYEVNKKHVKVNTRELKKYKYIVVEYDGMSDKTYYFTNSEREIFEPAKVLPLEHEMNDKMQSVFVYGCTGKIDEANLYSIPSEAMRNSIDLCCDDYDILDETSFEKRTENNEIVIPEEVKDSYDWFIVDYLKNNSYAINYDVKKNQYCLDIVTDNSFIVTYDMDEDSNTESKIITEYNPEVNQYIILARRPDFLDNEDTEVKA